MKRLIFITLGLFMVLILTILLFEYQPWYNPKTNPAPLDDRISKIDISQKEDSTINNTTSGNLSSNLYIEKTIDKDEFLNKILEDSYDFKDVQGDYRTKINDYYSNTLYKQCWNILKHHASIRTIEEKEGMSDDYITLELTYFAPKDNSLDNVKAIIQKYDGEYESVKDYVDVFYAQSNIIISRKTDYVQIDENFYEFIILEDNKNRLYKDTINIKDYEITLWYDPYTS